MSDMYEHLRLCAEHGVNAVTIAEEALYPVEHVADADRRA